MQALYPLSSPDLVLAWMVAILIGAAIPAITALVRSAGGTHSPAPARVYRRRPRTA